MPDSDNGRVSLAIVQNEITHLRGDVERMHRDLCQKVKDGDDRIAKMLEDHEERLRTLEGSQPWNVWRDLGTFVTAVIAGVAGWLNNN